MLPRAGHCGKARDRVHLRAAVARAREAETDAEEAALGPPVEPGELDDRRFGTTGDPGRPGGVSAPEMLLELPRRVRVSLEIGPVGKPFLEEDVHHAAGERPVGAR